MPIDVEPPLFRQITAMVEDMIIDGALKPGQRAPSTNELAAFHGINPATARKGTAVLVERGVLEKRRGQGVFVRPGAREQILRERRERFLSECIVPLVDEAGRLGMPRAELMSLIDDVAAGRGVYGVPGLPRK